MASKVACRHLTTSHVAKRCPAAPQLENDQLVFDPWEHWRVWDLPRSAKEMGVVCAAQLERPNGCPRWPRRAVRSGRTGRRGASGREASPRPKTPLQRPPDCSRGGRIHCATRFALIGSPPPRTCHARRWRPGIRRGPSFRITEPSPPRPKARPGSPSSRSTGHERDPDDEKGDQRLNLPHPKDQRQSSTGNARRIEIA